MKEVLYPDFPVEEYRSRYSRTQQVLKRRGIDALFLTQRQNMRYFAGVRDGAWDAHHFYFLSLLPAEGEPVLLTSKGFNQIVKQSWIEDAREWSLSREFYMSKESNAISAVLDVLREKHLDRGVIGMETGPEIHVHMGHTHFTSLLAGLKGAEIVDGSDAIWEVRSIKSEAEIDRMRKAADITTRGVKAGFEALKPGMSEKELVNIMSSEMCSRGASEQRFNSLYAGPRAMWADGMPTDYVMEKGDLVQYDGGCIYEGYCCDFKRMASIGEPRADQRRFYEQAKAVLFAAIGTVKPGAPLSAPLRAAFAVNDAAGFGSFSKWCLESGWSAIGHSLGLDLHEQPGLTAFNEAEMQENMVLCVEPFITLNGVTPFYEAEEKFGLEDVVVVTKDGVETLTSEDKITHDLWIA